MGLISGAIDAALESIGRSLLDVGEWFLKTGYTLWKNAGKLTLDYVKISPMSLSGAWGVVTGSVYQMSLAIAASLAVLFFVMGWLRESIDIRNNFSLENMFRFFIRYAITASLIVNSLSLVTGICECATAITQQISVNMDSAEVESVFDTVREDLEADDDADGGTWIGMGLAGMLGGFFGGAVIMVCGVSLVLSVLSRLFKLLLCIPFAPAAFAGFAGGHEFAQTGIAWLRTFIGYALEAVVIALAIAISYGMFSDANMFTNGVESGSIVSLLLLICGYCMPMVTACACVKGAEMTVRRCLGLG